MLHADLPVCLGWELPDEDVPIKHGEQVDDTNDGQ